MKLFKKVHETSEESFRKHYDTADFLLNILGLNIFDPNWFSKGQSFKKFVCLSYITLVHVSAIFAFICAFDTYKNSLEDQLSSLLAAFFALQVRNHTYFSYIFLHKKIFLDRFLQKSEY